MATTTAPAALDVTTRVERAWDPRSPLGIAVALYAAITAALLWASYHAAHGHLVYALDDPYIEMAMAKSLALHGIWGITRYGFSSASSSPLYTLLLAGVYRLTGIHQATSLLLSWTFGLIAIWQADRFAEPFLKAPARAAALAAFIVFGPLFAIGILGMEHTLHLALVLVFLRLFQRAGEAPYHLGAMTALMVAARYESLFLVVAAVPLLLLDRRVRASLCVIVGAALPVCAYAAFSLAHGGWIVPNSIAIKQSTPHGALFLIAIVAKFVTAPHVSCLIAALIAAGVALRHRRPALARLALVLAIAGALHLITAGIGSAFRYETYLVSAAILVLVCALSSLSLILDRTRYVFLSALLLAIGFLGSRAVTAAISLPKYSRAVYDQQVQMATFLSESFPHASVAANDIGAISFLNDIHCTDLIGLADSHIFFATRANRYTTTVMQSEVAANGARMAMVYDDWFSGRYTGIPRLPAQWIRVARLRVPHSENLGGDVVSFYAVDPSLAGPLRNALRQFQPTLPAEDQLTLEP